MFCPRPLPSALRTLAFLGLLSCVPLSNISAQTQERPRSSEDCAREAAAWPRDLKPDTRSTLYFCPDVGPTAVGDAWVRISATDSATLTLLVRAAAQFPDARLTTVLLRIAEDSTVAYERRRAAVAVVGSHLSATRWPHVRPLVGREGFEVRLLGTSHRAIAEVRVPLDASARAAAYERLAALDRTGMPWDLRWLIRGVLKERPADAR